MTRATAVLAGAGSFLWVSMLVTDLPAQQSATPVAGPSFEVATIKPTDPSHPAAALPLGHQIDFPATTVRFLLAFVYGVQDQQIVNAPAWMASEKYDFAGVPEGSGTPSVEQIQLMFQKLFAERLQLSFHRERREMPSYLLTVTRGGARLQPATTDTTTGHSFLGNPSVGMHGHALSMTEFAARLQSGILDRPVLDRTNLPGIYDFTLRWTPDETQFHQTGNRMPPPSGSADAPPGLYTALEEQLGLKLVSAKALVEVLVIDHVERPSGN